MAAVRGEDDGGEDVTARGLGGKISDSERMWRRRVAVQVTAARTRWQEAVKVRMVGDGR